VRAVAARHLQSLPSCSSSYTSPSTVDPEKLEGLDRRSTILLRASREPTHETEKEIAGMEDRTLLSPCPHLAREVTADGVSLLVL
jgi:hypothetical protein